MNKILLIDGNSIMNRAFYGIRELTNSQGLHTNAIYGFLNIMLKMIDEEQATHVAVAFDLKAPTFRHIKYEAYKGTRKGMPDELREQMPVIKQLLNEMEITICEIEGYEADDILGSLAVLAQKSGYNVTVLSGDRDMLQIASNIIKISIPKTKGGMTVTEHYYAKDVLETYGVTPTEFIDVKGLMGDTSDNIPGVPGIGEKTAVKLIQTYHSIENIYENIDKLTGKMKESLVANKELALLSKELATICTECDTGIALEKCQIGQIYTEKAYKTFKQLELKSFFDRFSLSNETEKSVEETQNESNILTDENQLKEIFLSQNSITYLWIKDEHQRYLSFVTTDNCCYYTDSNLINASVIDSTVEKAIKDKNCTKITHDLKTQLHGLNLDLSVDNKSIYDLFIMAYLINPIKETYYVDDIANEFLNKPIKSLDELLGKGKSRKHFYEIDQEDVKAYFASCVNILHESYELMKQRLNDDGIMDLYFDIELPLLYVLKNMETLGVKVDAQGLKAYSDKLQAMILELELKIYDAAGETFNINSPKQLGVILYEKLGLPSGKKTKTSYSTAADVLEKLKYKHPIVMDILNYRQLTKLKSTYADGLVNYIDKDGRIHSHFNQQITSTGRISSTEPNLQNIPIRMEIGREIRKVFISRENYLLVDADYSQIELRILAHLSGDETFIEAFRNNMDIHTITASQVFHIPFEEVTALQRRNAKAVNFGIVYGISAFGLSEDLGITRKEASDYIDSYFAKYPKVKEFLDETVQKAKKDGYVKTMYGRIRQIPELNSSNFMQRSFGERIAMNTPIQGTAADIIKIAMIRVYKALQDRGLRSRLILTVHDELLIETHKDEIDEVKALLIHEMENAASLKVPLSVDAHVGTNWYEAK